MGIYKTSSIGVRRKSVGEVTYKSVRGRVIASAKVTENTSKTPAQTEQRSAFGIMGQSAKVMASWIDQAFSKTKYGSQRNNFVKQNAPVMSWLKENKDTLKGSSLGKFSQSVAAGVPVLSGFGSNFVDAEFEQDNAALSVVVTFSKDFVANDIIKIGVMQSYSKAVPNDDGMSILAHFSSVKIYEYTVTNADLSSNIIILDKDKIPALETAAKPPIGFVPQTSIASAVVLSGKETSQSYFTALALFDDSDDRPEIE